MDLALIKIGDGRKPDVRMRPHVSCGGDHDLQRTELVEKDEWPDHLPLRGRQHATNERVDVDRTRHDQGFDRVNSDRIGEGRLEQRVPTHDASFANPILLPIRAARARRTGATD
jgi:hypothetical protein